MVAADDQREDRGEFLAGVVRMEVAELAILLRYGKRMQIGMVADRLKVAAKEEGIDLDRLLAFGAEKRGVDGIQLAVAAALDGEFHAVLPDPQTAIEPLPGKTPRVVAEWTELTRLLRLAAVLDSLGKQSKLVGRCEGGGRWKWSRVSTIADFTSSTLRFQQSPWKAKSGKTIRSRVLGALAGMRTKKKSGASQVLIRSPSFDCSWTEIRANERAFWCLSLTKRKQSPVQVVDGEILLYASVRSEAAAGSEAQK